VSSRGQGTEDVARRKPSTRTPTERLRLFSTRVTEMLDLGAIQNGTIKAHFTITADQDHTVIDQDDSDVDHVRSLMLAFRRFHANDEDAQFFSIANIVEQAPNLPDDLRAAQRTNRASWKRTNEIAAFGFSVNDQSHPPKYWFDVWTNGHLFHDVDDATRIYDGLDDLTRMFAEHTVHSMVIDGIKVLTAERNLIEDGFNRGAFAGLDEVAMFNRAASVAPLDADSASGDALS
jgi:hypothetical protein